MFLLLLKNSFLCYFLLFMFMLFTNLPLWCSRFHYIFNYLFSFILPHYSLNYPKSPLPPVALCGQFWNTSFKTLYPNTFSPLKPRKFDFGHIGTHFILIPTLPPVPNSTKLKNPNFSFLLKFLYFYK